MFPLKLGLQMFTVAIKHGLYIYIYIYTVTQIPMWSMLRHMTSLLS